MLSRRTNLSQITKNMFHNDYEQDSLQLSSPLKSPDKYNDVLSQNQSPLKLVETIDSIDNLLGSQQLNKPTKFSQFNLKKMLSKMDENENTNIKEIIPSTRQFRFKRFEHQSVPALKLDIKNDVDDFFNNNDTPIQLKKKKECKQYKLVTFTDYVENIYGKDWFQQRNLRRKNTIQEFFDVLE